VCTMCAPRDQRKSRSSQCERAKQKVLQSAALHSRNERYGNDRSWAQRGHLRSRSSWFGSRRMVQLALAYYGVSNRAFKGRTFFMIGDFSTMQLKYFSVAMLRSMTNI
jgi:hypothetical protein